MLESSRPVSTYCTFCFWLHIHFKLETAVLKSNFLAVPPCCSRGTLQTIQKKLTVEYGLYVYGNVPWKSLKIAAAFWNFSWEQPQFLETLRAGCINSHATLLVWFFAVVLIFNAPKGILVQSSVILRKVEMLLLKAHSTQQISLFFLRAFSLKAGATGEEKHIWGVRFTNSLLYDIYFQVKTVFY